MIYTVTINPSLDYIVEVPNFEPGITNRTTREMMFPGGKGINVSKVLKNLGHESIALGFLAGFVGDEIKRLLDEDGIHSRFVVAQEGVSRINVKIKNLDGTEINGRGPKISDKEIKCLRSHLDQISKNDVLVLAGNIPEGVSDTIYMEIMAGMAERNILVAVDATNGLLMNVLPYRPFLIKPNHHELGEIFNTTLQTQEEVLEHAKRLQEKGARNVLVSMGGKGAVLAAENGKSYVSAAPKGVLVNAVGAGDSMVAGFLAGYMESENFEHAFKMSVATGSASAFSETFATKEEVKLLYNTLKTEG